MTQNSCAVGMRNAILRNYLKLKIKLKSYNENVAKHSTNEDKQVKILTLKKTSLPGKSQRLEEEFGLFRIIFTLPKRKQRNLHINSTEILKLK